MMKDVTFLVAVMLSSLLSYSSAKLEFIPKTTEISSGECVDVVLHSTEPGLENEKISLKAEYSDLATVYPPEIYVNNDTRLTWVIKVCGVDAGRTVIEAIILNSNKTVCYLHVFVERQHILKALSLTIGWIYFVAWSVSFYPQIYSNYVRKSVVGLNFDYVALNFIGFILYSLFNCGLFFEPFLQDEYFKRHPKGLIPVQFNDVFFSVHAIFGQGIVILQCLIYERNDQRVSMTAKMIMMLYCIIVVVTGTLSYVGQMNWLDFVYYCSYIKLSITLIKYIPQAVMNYRRQSTTGWSIGNVLLDFVGGTFSMLQMLIDGYNFNDWGNLLGDPTKFGLGAFSVGFDLVFMYQHYILYRNPYEEHRTSLSTSTTVENVSNASTKEIEDVTCDIATQIRPSSLYDVDTN